MSNSHLLKLLSLNRKMLAKPPTETRRVSLNSSVSF